MVTSPLAYVGVLTGQEQFIRVATTPWVRSPLDGSGGDGKSIAQQMNFSSDTLALLQQWYAAHRADRVPRC